MTSTPKRESNKERLLAALQAAGERGLTTSEACRVAGSRFGGRLWELRHEEGWVVDNYAIQGSEEERYVLRYKMDVQAPVDLGESLVVVGQLPNGWTMLEVCK